MFPLVVLAAISVVCLVLLELKDRRFQTERGQWAQERADLLQRIQAPEVAVAVHAEQRAPDGLAYVPFDDDEAWQLNREEELSGA